MGVASEEANLLGAVAGRRGLLTGITGDLIESVAVLLGRGQGQGTLRSDISMTDLIRLLAMLIGVVDTMEAGSDAWRRPVALVEDEQHVPGPSARDRAAGRGRAEPEPAGEGEGGGVAGGGHRDHLGVLGPQRAEHGAQGLGRETLPLRCGVQPPVGAQQGADGGVERGEAHDPPQVPAARR